MTVRLRADGTTGTVAIYTGTDDDPFTSPLSHIARLRFHSDLDYPRVVSTLTGSVSLPSMSGNSDRFNTNVIAAHGQAGKPFCEGYITVDADPTRVPLLGSVCVRQGPATGGGFFVERRSFFSRWLHLGSNDTNILLQENSVCCQGLTHPAMTINYTIYVTDTVV